MLAPLCTSALHASSSGEAPTPSSSSGGRAQRGTWGFECKPLGADYGSVRFICVAGTDGEPRQGSVPARATQPGIRQITASAPVALMKCPRSSSSPELISSRRSSFLAFQLHVVRSFTSLIFDFLREKHTSYKQYVCQPQEIPTISKACEKGAQISFMTEMQRGTRHADEHKSQITYPAPLLSPKHTAVPGARLAIPVRAERLHRNLESFYRILPDPPATQIGSTSASFVKNRDHSETADRIAAESRNIIIDVRVVRAKKLERETHSCRSHITRLLKRD